MRDRIINGEEWNVREAWSPYDFSSITYNDDGEQVGEVREVGAWYVVDDK
jgi:hypothetical protein